MKIRPEHYAALLPLVRAGMLRIPAIQSYEARDPAIRGAALIKDPARRYRWDTLWAADGAATREWTSAVYEYANDAHIDTALKAAIRHWRSYP